MVNNPPLKLQETTSATAEVSIDQHPRLSIWMKDPWKIKKKLVASDLEDNQLTLHTDQVERYILPHLLKENLNIWDGHEVGVRVWDCDTQSEHQLVLAHECQSTMRYMLKCIWTIDFVKRRNLNVGDEVGLFWDASQGPDSLLIYFTVLHRANLTS